MTPKESEFVSSRSNLGVEFCAACIVTFAPLVVFFRVLHFDFIHAWDDVRVLTGNPHFRGLGADQLRWMFTTTEFPAFYIPLSWLSWGLTYVLFGMNPFGYHLGNLLLHSINALLVYFLIREFLKIGKAETQRAERRTVALCAGIGSLFWSLHPLRVEPVAISAGRPYGLSTFFILVALLAYLRSCRDAATSPASERYYWIAVLAYAASLLSYPLGVGLFPVLAFLDVYPLKRLSVAKGEWRGPSAGRVLLEKIPFALVAVAVAAATLINRQKSSIMAPMPSLKEFGLASRIMQGFYVASYYFWVILDPRDLSPVYVRLVSFKPTDPVFLLSMAWVISASVCLLVLRRRWPMGLTLWLCHLVLLLPVLGLTIHPHYANDRYSYMQGVVWSVALSVGLMRLVSTSAHRTTTWIVALGMTGLCTLLGILSAHQTRIWRNGLTLLPYVIEKIGNHPYRADMLRRLAQNYDEAGEETEAMNSLNEALAVNSNFADAIWLRGVFKFKRGDLSGAEQDLSAALKVNPSDAEARQNLGVVLDRQGKLDAAIERYQEALKARPDWAEARFDMALTRIKQGKTDEAIADLRETLRMDPTHAKAHLQLAILLFRRGDFPQATEHFGAAVRLDPSDAQARNGLGSALATQGRVKEAVAEFERALKLNPNDPATLANLEQSRRQLAQKKGAK